MFLSFGLLLKAILLVAGVWWCKEIFGRLRSDMADFKETDDNAKKAAMVFVWVLTIVIMFLIINFLWGLVRNIVDAFG